MKHIIILKSALSPISLANLREFNREHHPVIVTIVDDLGFSDRYKLPEEVVSEYILKGISQKHYIVV